MLIGAGILVAAGVWASDMVFCAEKVTIKTPDGWSLSADYSSPAKTKPIVVMFHGLGAGKGEWQKFENKISSSGIGWLAVDFRGHGESLCGPGGKRDYRTFTSKKDWAKLEADITASLAFLKKKKIAENRIILAGASIGANLALNAAVRIKPVYKGLILLSPGLDYQSITAESAIKRTGKMPVVIAAAPNDSYAYQSSIILKQTAEKASASRGINFIEAAEGHGNMMFDGKANESAGVLNKLSEWILGLK